LTRITVKPESADQPDVADLLRLSDQVAAKLYPNNGRQPFDVKKLFTPDIVVLVARTENGCSAGCCALLVSENETIELKRMIVSPKYRNWGVGKSFVAFALNLASTSGMTAVQLEVGRKNSAAQAMYLGAGFKDRGPFADHKDSPMSRFMELTFD